MRHLPRKKAFTLIEILVVIGIIALLAAILFPVLSSARERARTSSCLNNEKQIAMALSQYTQDYARRFPINPVCVDPSDPAKNLCDGWAYNIGPTLKDVFQCPSEEQAAVDGYTDYWLNSELMGVSNVRIRYPSNTILIGDGDAGAPTSNMSPTSLPPWDANAGYTERHFDGANYAFVDGHVKWLKSDSITVDDAAAGNNFAFRIKAP